MFSVVCSIVIYIDVNVWYILVILSRLSRFVELMWVSF